MGGLHTLTGLQMLRDDWPEIGPDEVWELIESLEYYIKREMVEESELEIIDREVFSRYGIPFPDKMTGFLKDDLPKNSTK